MQFKKRFAVILASLSLAFAALSCGGYSGSDYKNDSKNQKTGDTADAVPSNSDAGSTAPDSAGESEPDQSEDIKIIGEIDEGSELKGEYKKVADAWPLNEKVSEGNVNTEKQEGFRETKLDASAGGMSAASRNAFVYFDLESGSKVEITDIESLDDKQWDLAFRRISIRTNSADSGPGSIEVAKQTDTTLADVTEMPSGATFEVDESVKDGTLRTDPLGNPYTAFNYLNENNETGSQSWYNYGGQGGGHGVSPAKKEIYIVKNNSESTAYKLKISAWDDGKYTLKWAEIE